MGKLTRRDVSLVEARRVPPPQANPPQPPLPQTVFIPMPPPVAAQPPTGAPPHVTQNFINVTVPPAAAPPPPGAPTEIHHHHNTVNYSARPLAPARGLSFFGAVGLVLGALSCAAFYFAQATGFARPLAIAGLAAGALGTLSAMLIGRTGRAVPILAMLVSAVGYGLALASTGQLAPTIRQVSNSLPAALPRIQVNTSGGHIDISMKPSGATTESPAIPPSRSAAQPPSAPQPSASADPAAQAQLEAARIAAAGRMGLDYTGAKAAADRAAADLRAARDVDAPGSPELIAASQASMNANSALAAVQVRLRADPTVAAAEQAARK